MSNKGGEFKLDFGLNFFGVLTLMLIAFKITGYIDWSWWLVFSPMILQFSLVVLFLLVITLAAL